MKYHSEHGSVFIYILLAISLFAAISYYTSQGSRATISQLSDDQARIAANEIVEFSDKIAAAVQKLILRGCAETELSFANNVYQLTNGTPIHAAGHNANAPTDGTCDVFNISGGGMNAIEFPENYGTEVAGNSTKPAHMGAFMYDILGIGNDGDADMVWLGITLNQDICMTINEILGVPNSTTEPPQDDDMDGTTSSYNGTFPAGMSVLGNDATELNGKTAFCFRRTNADPTDGAYIYVHTLIAR